MNQDTDYTRMFVAIFLAAIVLFAWQALVEWPRRQALSHYTVEKTKKQAAEQAKHVAALPVKESAEENPSLPRAERLKASKRLSIRSGKLHGSIALKGARFDDLTLAAYRMELDPASPEVTLLSPVGDAQAYFAQVGWVAADGNTRVPDGESLWQSDKAQLTPGEAAHLRWDNGQGQTFVLTVALDDHYMFTIGQRVENHSGAPVAVMPYGYINRAHDETKSQQNAILHEGPLGVMQGTLEEVSYKDLREKGGKTFEHASGWLGVTDKYWLAALIPAESDAKVTFSHYQRNGHDRYQADYLGESKTVGPSSSAESSVRLFAGAKEIHVLDAYTHGEGGAPIALFDRAVDFGALYFLTKPLFLTLSYFYKHVGNFGLAIMLLTILVKLVMFPLANKSFHAAAQMRELQPEVMKIREKFFDDHIALNKEMMGLYKREKVNPAAGCLPLLIQLPVFFALYKVLYVTIEMRHAPFFAWIKDLSAPDPANLFTLFGLVPWNHPAALHLGVLPILFCATMVIQMRQQPKPADPIQAKMMAWMPYIFLFLFTTFPAGLVLYWTWSNLLSILQQHIITLRHKAAKHKKASRKAKEAA